MISRFPRPTRFRPLITGLLAASLLPGPGADRPVVAQDAPSQKLALLIAVRQYNKNELRPLNYTENDVAGLAKTLKAAGYRRVVLMTQTVGAEETRYLPIAANIRKELRGLLNDRNESDSLVIALSGHGVQFKGQDEAYFCPADAKLSDRSTLVSIAELYRDLEKSQAGFKLLFVDACRNDPQSDNSKARAEVDLASVTRPQKQKPPGGLAVFFSCSEGEKSFESSELKNGIFFHYVLKGLDGAADFNKDRKITLEELSLYAKQEVPERVKEEFDADLRQMPELVGKTRGAVPVVELGSLTPDKAVISKTTGMKLVLISKGDFRRGSPDSDKDAQDREKPQHTVQITRDFYLGQHEVTQGEWNAVMNTEPWKDQLSVKEGKDYAASYISWNDAQEFCKNLSQRDGATYRLPTEAEWEFACRGDTTTRYSFGDDASKLSDHAWYRKNANDSGEQYAHRVGQKKPNLFGLYDMHGNVFEWCQDAHDDKEYAKHIGKMVADPQGPSFGSRRVLRGGSWNTVDAACRSACRDYFISALRMNFTGFRVAAIRQGQ